MVTLIEFRDMIQVVLEPVIIIHCWLAQGMETRKVVHHESIEVVFIMWRVRRNVRRYSLCILTPLSIISIFRRELVIQGLSNRVRCK
jgi:hypothetical protein